MSNLYICINKENDHYVIYAPSLFEAFNLLPKEAKNQDLTIDDIHLVKSDVGKLYYCSSKTKLSEWINE